MHVRVRFHGNPDAIVVVPSRLSDVGELKKLIQHKFNVEPGHQRLFYGGKMLENTYTLNDYGIKLNDVIQLMATASSHQKESKEPENEAPKKQSNELYKDATCEFYKIGDLVDLRDMTHGDWVEGTIIGIVYKDESTEKCEDDNKDMIENVSPNAHKVEYSLNEKQSDAQVATDKSQKKTLHNYFNKAASSVSVQKATKKLTDIQKTDIELLYKIRLDYDNRDDPERLCKFKQIRPRSRKVIDVNDLQVGDIVMVNRNIDDINEIGFWYDYKLERIIKKRLNYHLMGTLFIGSEDLPKDNTEVIVLDKIFKIEIPLPHSQRTAEEPTQIEKRSQPLLCLKCRDKPNVPCKHCGCQICSKTNDNDKTILCDECNKGYHFYCLTPPITTVPDDDWYCPSCKHDTASVVAPGAAKQLKKKSSVTTRDWGRGMACVGKTKTSVMPANHFGPIPGVEVGMMWRFRIQLSETGVHRPPVAGIHGRDTEGAYSIVLAGGYEDDYDNGMEFTYTGSGGRDLSGNKRTAEQSCDQTLTRENRALARNCAVTKLSDNGADAGNDWRKGKPVRVTRSAKMVKHFPKFAPKEGIRYDGIYKVVKYYQEKGKSGFNVWKYLLRRDDPNPAPWEAGAKKFEITYPEGYLEAQAEKNSLEKTNKGPTQTVKAPTKKKTRNESVDAPRPKRYSKGNVESQTEKKSLEKTIKTPTQTKKDPTQKRTKKESVDAPKAKKVKLCFDHNIALEQNKNTKSQLLENDFNYANYSTKKATKIEKNILNNEELNAIYNDKVNEKYWNECLEVGKNGNKQEFIEHMMQTFLCIICQELVVKPVTTPCLHNICMRCIKVSFKSSLSHNCPHCRNDLTEESLKCNEELTMALRTIMPGYDANK